MTNPGRLKQTLQVLRDVPLEIAQADGVSKYAAAALLGTPCGIPQALELNLFEHPEKLVRCDVGDWANSQGGKDLTLQNPSGVFERVGGELTFGDARLQEFQPLACDDFERMRVRRTPFFAIGTGIYVPCEQPARIGVQTDGLWRDRRMGRRRGISSFRFAESDNGTATISNRGASHEDSCRVRLRERNGAREVLRHAQSER
jgi:hypothetical protein